MINQIKICKYVNEIIDNDLNIKQKINDRIYQSFQKNGTDKPYIITGRGSIKSSVTKDKRIDNQVLVNIDIYSNRYDEQIDIQVLIDEQLSRTHQVLTTGEYFYIVADEFSESHDGVDTFIQSITFRVFLK